MTKLCASKSENASGELDSFLTGGGAHLFVRTMRILVICCSITTCQGRQTAFPQPTSAFCSHAMPNSLSKRVFNLGAPPPFSNSAAVAKRPLYMSSEMKKETDESFSSENSNKKEVSRDENIIGWMDKMVEFFPPNDYAKPPPFQVEDTSVLFYDVFLILNLSVSISFWAVHRMDFDFIGSAVSEGSLFCLLWIAAGLYNGAFLYSAVDGHYGSADKRGGPKAAGLLGLHTFMSASSMRIVVALAMAVLEHRKVGLVAGEQLIPLEIAFGLLLMSMWRALHSSYVPRV